MRQRQSMTAVGRSSNLLALYPQLPLLPPAAPAEGRGVWGALPGAASRQAHPALHTSGQGSQPAGAGRAGVAAAWQLQQQQRVPAMVALQVPCVLLLLCGGARCVGAHLFDWLCTVLHPTPTGVQERGRVRRLACGRAAPAGQGSDGGGQ